MNIRNSAFTLIASIGCVMMMYTCTTVTEQLCSCL